MTHLAPDELIDAIDGALSPARRAHLDTCSECRREATALRALMSEVRSSNVPEPSPLYWDRFSARVREAIDGEDARPDAPARRWFEWPVFAPMLGFALLVFALVSAVPLGPERDVSESHEGRDAGAAAADVLDLESEWALLEDLVGDLDVDAAHEAGIATLPGIADRAVLQLSLVEQQELMRLLREELRAGG